MSLTSPPSGNRPLAAELIRLTGQRARVAQQLVGGGPDNGNGDPSATDPTIEVIPDSTAEPTVDSPNTVDEPDRPGVDAPAPLRVGTFESIYPCVDDPDLPSPALTNTNLRHYLGSAMDTQPGFEAEDDGAKRGLRSRVRRLIGAPRQAEFNAAVLHVLHQLDHRSQVQERRIVALEARLAGAEARIGGGAETEIPDGGAA